MSNLTTKLSAFDLSGCNTVRQALAALIKSEGVQDTLEAVCSRIRFREFSSRDQNINIDTVADAVEIFLESENVKACELYLASHLDTSEALHDLLRDVMHIREFSPLIEALAHRVVKRFPETKKILPNIASEVVLDAIINIVRKRDASSPLDALKGINITVAYLPGFDRMKSGRLPTVNYFSDMRDATTIAPDQLFRDFMAMTGVTKEQWIRIVREKTGMALDQEDSGSRAGRAIAQEWTRANWAASGKALVAPEQLFESIDASAHGFTPLVAISIDAYRFVKRDWSKPMTISGGILGLHDFDNGTGDPLRFEGTRILEARPCQFVQPEMQKFGLALSHGFTEGAFKCRMKDANGTMDMLLTRTEAEIATEIVTAVRINFGIGTQWAGEDIDVETLRDIAAEALRSHLRTKKEAAIEAVASFDREEAASLLVGLQGRDHARMNLIGIANTQRHHQGLKSRI